MGGEECKDVGESKNPYLGRTTYRVYNYILKQDHPVGISDVKRALGFSSSSVSEYHLKKLLGLGLIREEEGGYVIDKVVVENVIRIGHRSVPTYAGYASFFGVSLLVLIVFLRPSSITSLFFFALAIDTIALSISLYEIRKTLKRI